MSDVVAHPGHAVKARRKEQGWSRAELADRAALDPRVVQLVELGEWNEHEALGRLDAVLAQAEAGVPDPRLAAPRPTPEQRIDAPLGGDDA
ncbi:MAG: hypothetical protein H6742_06400 [Alphaproteobacteria bacterium]|nr:hypothetical protein [Alphaproteobacteria bacterium]